jgi:hypothetical protein
MKSMCDYNYIIFKKKGEKNKKKEVIPLILGVANKECWLSDLKANPLVKMAAMIYIWFHSSVRRVAVSHPALYIYIETQGKIG